MLPEHGPLGVDDGTGTKRFGNSGPQEAPVVVVRDEADLLALGLVGRHQAQRARLLSHGLLREIAYGKARRGKLLLRQRPQEVRLVLSPVTSAPEQIAPRVRILT